MTQPDDSLLADVNDSLDPEKKSQGYEEFEVGEHRVPMYLWIFFILILMWAGVSWFPFVGY